MLGWIKSLQTALGAKQNRAFLWACVLCAILGAIDAAAPLDSTQRALRNRLREQPASGNIVLMLPDDPSGIGANDWNWSRANLSELVSRLRAAGAERIAISRLITEKPANGDRLVQELMAMPARSIIAMSFDVNPETGERRVILPPQDLARVADAALNNQYYDAFGRVHETPYRIEVAGQEFLGLSALLSGRDGMSGALAPIDYAITMPSVPLVSVQDLKDAIGEGVLGKTVLIASAESRMNAEGRGRVPSAYAHVIAAETLLRGEPTGLGWLPAFGIALALAACVWFGKRRAALTALGVAIVGFVFLPVLLEARLIFIQTTVALLLVLIVTAIRFYRSFRRAGTRENSLSGLPNLAALRERTLLAGEAVVVAKVANYAELVSVVTVHEKILSQMIASRIATGGLQLYHGDGGVFAWIAPESSVEGLGDHLDALHAFFLTPVSVGSWQVDVNIAFGIDLAGDKDMATCFACASVAADEAAGCRMRWAFYDSARLNDAEWNVSLLGKLDAAIESGEVWVAYQPQIDVESRRVSGFEALVRWTHPERGAISPEQFVSVAESHGRIDRLTYFVLDDALAMLAGLSNAHAALGVAVNVSARMFGRDDFLPRVRAALKQHAIAPSRLIMEITESAAAESEVAMLACVAGLVKMGVQVSIDDYGTGYSTLDYLKKLNAQELKIDRSFIAGMDRNRSDFMLVKATIDLAHSLGHRVVAEGVETPETMDMLAKLGCDVAQGFLIARPMSRADLATYVAAEPEQRAA